MEVVDRANDMIESSPAGVWHCAERENTHLVRRTSGYPSRTVWPSAVASNFHRRPANFLGVIQPAKLEIVLLYPHPLQVIFLNRRHLLRRRRRPIKRIAQPLRNQPPRQLHPNDPPPQTQHLRIIAAYRPLHRKAIVRRHCPHSGHFVCTDRHAEARPADQHRAVRFSGGDQPRCCDGVVRLCGLVGGRERADVADGGDARVGGQVGGDGVFVGEAGVGAAEDDTERLLGHGEEGSRVGGVWVV